ncbi:MAG: DNA polymerase [bacterium]
MKENLLKCTLCSTLQPDPVPMQMGTGPERILLVGEAPGAEEAAGKVPFIGSAGRVLNACLSQAGLRRENLSVTNVIRCRPPNNRTPLSEEVANCQQWLAKEIALIKPTLLVALGDTATRALTNKSLEWRGSVIDSIHGIPCLVTYHPAYVMRARTEFSVLVADLSKALGGREKEEPTEYLTDPPIQVAQEKVHYWSKKMGRPIAVDIETAKHAGDGLNPYRDIIIGYALCGGRGDAFSYALHVGDHHERWKLLKDVVENCDTIYQKNLFDRSFLRVQGMKPTRPVWDTMDAMYVLNSDSDKSLDFLRSIYTNIPPYKRSVKRRGGVSTLSRQELSTYNCLDVDVTWRVAKEQKKYFSPVHGKVMSRMLALDDLALKMRIRGVPISKEAIAKNFLDLEPTVARLEEEFYTRWGTNPNSPKQLAELMYDRHKMPLPPHRRGKSDRSTDEVALDYLLERAVIQEDVEMLTSLKSYREHSIILKTFVQGWFDRIEADGRLHPDWTTTGTDTGRWSCKSPNMQNPPERTRNQVWTKKMLIGGDYRSLEFLIMLIRAGDWHNVQLVLDGRDIHGEIQKEMSQYFPATRLQAKATVFGTAYGLTAQSGARRFKVPLRIMLGWQDVCFQRFPLLVALAEKHRQEWKSKGYAESAFGRRKYCQTENEALNHPIQSTGADITHNACLALEEAGFNPIINIHDEVVCEVEEPRNEREGENLLAQFEKIMNNAGKEVYEFFPCKARISKTWQKEVT